MDTLYTFGDNITHYKTKSVHFLWLMNSATKLYSSLPLVISSQTLPVHRYPGSCHFKTLRYILHPKGPKQPNN